MPNLPYIRSRLGIRLFSSFLTLTLSLSSSSLSSLHAESGAAPDQPAVTTITINASNDPDSSLSKTCNYTSGVYVAASDGRCTLRRAILEAAARPPADRPITIQFNLPITDTNKDLEVAGTWTLDIEDTLPPLRTQSIANLTGKVTIDGNTQPGGRSDGPKIILNTNDNSLQIESEENIIRNLAFKGGGALFLKENGNLVEKIWMGLSDDGQEIVFRTGQAIRMAGGGIDIASDNNTIQNNVISGAFARAIDVDFNSNNLIQNNLIGTRADGTVPAVPSASQCLRSLSRDPQNWYGGWGIAINGSNNQVIGNRIAGLHIVQTQNSTPPIALEIFGSDHEIRNNVIGIDSAGNKVGVCGQGIKISGSGTQVLDNVITRSRAGFEDDEKTAIMSSDSSPAFGQITVRRNLVEEGPGNVYEFGPGIPSLLRNYNPAKVTQINGKTVSGTAGNNSPCGGCLIDLYTDNSDEIGEALSYLGEATADSNGNFSFSMTQTLPSGVGIRTSSTTQSAGVIGNYLAGTTTQFSKLYLPMSSVVISGPSTGSVGITYTFTITVSPVGATIPLSYPSAPVTSTRAFRT
ncbi:MAG: hypothetical protein U0175_26645 [Caldilineaceae bacterium]